MKRSESLLLESVRGALWGTGFTQMALNHDEFAALIDLAERQTVVGLVGHTLMDKGVQLEKADAARIYVELQTIKNENKHVSLELFRYVRALTKRQICYIVVKGQVLATLYPNPLLRMSGDVDMYLAGENFERAKALAEEKLHLQFDDYGDRKHIEFEAHGVLFELHYRLVQFARNKSQRYWDELIDKSIAAGTADVNIGDATVCTLRGTCNVLYVFIHLFFHMTSSGLGLRQLCDLAVLMHQCRLQGGDWEVDDKELEIHLRALGLWKAFRVVGAFLTDYLGLPEEDFPFELTAADRKWSNRIWTSVAQGGNFGKSNHKVEEMGVLHKMESVWLLMRQTLMFAALAPHEVLGLGMNHLKWASCEFLRGMFGKHG